MTTPGVKPDRMAVRALAERNMAALQEVANAGGNPYQKGLEQQDELEAFAETLTPEQAVAFHGMYAEELDACSKKTQDEANNILAQAEAQGHAAEAIGGVIGFCILLVILFFIFK